MKVLVVEDDENKLRQITRFLESEYGEWDVIERHSYQAGLKSALTDKPDILLLDMTMHTYVDRGQESGGRERRYAGEQILRYLQRKKVSCVALIITQFERFGDGGDQITIEELKSRLAREFAGMYRGTVFYQAGGRAWTDELRQLLDEIGS